MQVDERNALRLVVEERRETVAFRVKVESHAERFLFRRARTRQCNGCGNVVMTLPSQNPANASHLVQ